MIQKVHFECYYGSLTIESLNYFPSYQTSFTTKKVQKVITRNAFDRTESVRFWASQAPVSNMKKEKRISSKVNENTDLKKAYTEQMNRVCKSLQLWIKKKIIDFVLTVIYSVIFRSGIVLSKSKQSSLPPGTEIFGKLQLKLLSTILITLICKNKLLAKHLSDPCKSKKRLSSLLRVKCKKEPCEVLTSNLTIKQ